MRGILGSLLGFWPLKQNRAGAIKAFYRIAVWESDISDAFLIPRLNCPIEPAFLSAAIFENFVHLSYFASQLKASLSDQHTRLDIAIFARDSRLTLVARSIISSAQARGMSQDLRLLVPHEV